MENLQYYLVPGIFILLFGWRFYKFRKVKAELPKLIAKGAMVVDVRTPQEFAQGARPDSLNLPLSDLVARAKELDPKKTIILCCASGTRSGIALGILRKMGFKNLVNAGPWMNTLV